MLSNKIAFEFIKINTLRYPKNAFTTNLELKLRVGKVSGKVHSDFEFLNSLISS